ncbi:MAG: DUF6916 family protein [Actinomycetes bacterium]
MSAVSRRGFLSAAAVVGASVAMPFQRAQSAWAGTATTGLTRSRFSKYVGATFRVTGAGFAGHVVLYSVEDITAAPANDEDRFAVLFRAPASSTAAEQGTYTFRQSAFGRADLFIVPVDRAVSARYYQAIVNHPA